MIQDGNRAPLFSPPPVAAPEWFLLWMRQYLVPILKEIRYIHNALESHLIPSGAVYPYTLTWDAPAPDATYCVLLSPEGGNATTALTVTAKSATAITITLAGTAPGNVGVLRIL
jgi:hypothetical protein